MRVQKAMHTTCKACKRCVCGTWLLSPAWNVLPTLLKLTSLNANDHPFEVQVCVEAPRLKPFKARTEDRHLALQLGMEEKEGSAVWPTTQCTGIDGKSRKETEQNAMPEYTPEFTWLASMPHKNTSLPPIGNTTACLGIGEKPHIVWWPLTGKMSHVPPHSKMFDFLKIFQTRKNKRGRNGNSFLFSKWNLRIKGTKGMSHHHPTYVLSHRELM